MGQLFQKNIYVHPLDVAFIVWADQIFNIYLVHQCGSVAEWLACWTQAQKGPSSNRSRDAVG